MSDHNREEYEDSESLSDREDSRGSGGRKKKTRRQRDAAYFFDDAASEVSEEESEYGPDDEDNIEHEGLLFLFRILDYFSLYLFRTYWQPCT